VLGVDQRGVGGFRGVVPFTGCGFSAGILRGGYYFKVFIF
jgi:hypothetical protein